MRELTGHRIYTAVMHLAQTRLLGTAADLHIVIRSHASDAFAARMRARRASA